MVHRYAFWVLEYPTNTHFSYLSFRLPALKCTYVIHPIFLDAKIVVNFTDGFDFKTLSWFWYPIIFKVFLFIGWTAVKMTSPTYMFGM